MIELEKQGIQRKMVSSLIVLKETSDAAAYSRLPAVMFGINQETGDSRGAFLFHYIASGNILERVLEIQAPKNVIVTPVLPVSEPREIPSKFQDHFSRFNLFAVRNGNTRVLEKFDGDNVNYGLVGRSLDYLTVFGNTTSEGKSFGTKMEVMDPRYIAMHSEDNLRRFCGESAMTHVNEMRSLIDRAYGS